MDVRLPDGTIIKNIPDGTSKADLIVKLKNNGYDTSSLGDVPKSSPLQQVEQPSFIDETVTAGKNLMKGNLAGAADIGNTLINASSFIPRKMASVASRIYGVDNPLEKLNQEREAGLKQFSKDNEDSTAFNLGRVASNVAGTAGVGNVLGMGVRGISQAPLATKIAQALESGGFNAPNANMATRAAGGAATGAATAGLVNPESAGTGAAIGGALPPATRIAGALGKGVGSAIEPFYQGGRERIIGRAITSAAGNQADDALINMQNAQPLVQGSQPTAGMVANNPGIAALERASIANSPISTNELALRQFQNNDARLAALQSAAPDKLAAQGAREAATSQLYSQSSQAPVKMTNELVTLLQRPSMQAAVSRASKLADEAGEKLDLNSLTGRSAQYIKMALDDMANASPMSGIGGNELRSIQSTRQAYLDQLGKQIPEYLEANKQYAALSAPLSQADLINEITAKGTSFRGDLTPAALSRAASDKTAQSVTGRSNATLQNTLTPEQMAVIQNVKQDLLNQDFAQTAGRGVGSNTVQNLAYSNMLDQIGIPTALREFAPAGVIGNLGARAGNVAYKSANERLANELANALLNPQTAAQAMQRSQQGVINPQLVNLIKQSLRATPALSAQ